jgi:hypothetical protein
MVIVDKLVELRLAEETEVLGENLPQGHFVYHKSHVTRPGLKVGHRSSKPVTNRLSYGAVFDNSLLTSNKSQDADQNIEQYTHVHEINNHVAVNTQNKIFCLKHISTRDMSLNPNSTSPTD